MPNRELSSDLNLNYSEVPQTFALNNTTQVGSLVDTQGFDSVTAVFGLSDFKADGVSDAFIEVALQHSDDTGSGWEDVPNAQLTNYITLTSTVTGAAETGGFGKYAVAADDDKQFKTGYIGNKRYLRIKTNGEKNQSSAGSIGFGAIILAHPNQAPNRENVDT